MSFECLITKKELSNVLGISSSTINRYMQTGLPYYRKGKRLLMFKLEECRDWIIKKYNKGE